MTTTIPNLAEAFAALPTYDAGASRAVLMPIDDAVRAGLKEAGARIELEQKLTAALVSAMSPVAKEYICRKLALIGSARSVSALAPLLGDSRLGDAARSALEAIPAPAAATALRRRLKSLAGPQRIGAINSLGARRDVPSLAALAALLNSSDNLVAEAAVSALGKIGTMRAADILLDYRPKAPPPIRLAVADACLGCADRLSAAAQPTKAAALYEALADAQQPNHIRLAAKQGLARLHPGSRS
jgi:HEAT repeat protein